MDKEDVTHTHTHTGILLSHRKNQGTPLAATWLDLEAVTFSEARQRRTHIVIVLMCAI